MGGAAAARIGEMNILEGDGRQQRDARPGHIRPVRRDQRLGGEKRVDAGSGRLPDHPLMQHHAQVSKRAEYFGSSHQDDQQCLDAHQPVRHPPHTKR